MKLSIIIALYNTEDYIEKCIRSVYLNNKLSINVFEVIVINDGSTDNSRIIVEKLQKEFANIILINKENGGQSSARNIGFDLAKGSYVFCLDSDDFIDSNELKRALEYCEVNDLDMLPVYYRLYTEDYQELPQKKDIYPIIDKPMTGGQFLCDFVISGSMWRYFYKTELIKQYNLILTEGIYHEDEEFVIKFLSYTTRISYQKHLVYNHIVRGNSTVNKKDKNHRKKLLNDLVTVIIHLDIHRDKFGKSNLEYIGISKKIEQLQVSVFFRMKSDKLNYNKTKEFIDRLKTVDLYPIKIKYQNLKFRLAVKLFNLDIFNKFYFKV